MREQDNDMPRHRKLLQPRHQFFRPLLTEQHDIGRKPDHDKTAFLFYIPKKGIDLRQALPAIVMHKNAGFIPIQLHTLDKALEIMGILSIHQQRMPGDLLLTIGFYPIEALIHSIAFHEIHLISGLSGSPGQNQGPSVYPADIHAADQRTYAQKSAPLLLSRGVHILS